jgi:ABC-type multidrug transport system ATPase subunit
MARYFLRDLDGFLILDDPLVDLDEERQRAASQVIQGFSKGKQVILFTCHPDHADYWGTSDSIHCDSDNKTIDLRHQTDSFNFFRTRFPSGGKRRHSRSTVCLPSVSRPFYCI